MKKAEATRQISGLEEFNTRYGAVLEAAARRVHLQVERGVKYTSTKDVAKWIANDLPTLYKATFGRGHSKPLMMWRVQTMLSNANYLGAYEALDIRAVRGRGLTSTVVPRKRAKLQLVRGGRA